jgi:hypothetical protein
MKYENQWHQPKWRGGNSGNIAALMNGEMSSMK